MKKLFLALAAICTLMLTSCTKDPSYVITYYDQVTSYSNLTIFEYSDSDELLYRHEIKDVRDGEVLEFDSTQGIAFVVVGCEGIVGPRIIEWYSDAYALDNRDVTYIEVDYTTMETYDHNPINPNHRISRYISK